MMILLGHLFSRLEYRCILTSFLKAGKIAELENVPRTFTARKLVQTHKLLETLEVIRNVLLRTWARKKHHNLHREDTGGIVSKPAHRNYYLGMQELWQMGAGYLQ